MYLSSLSEPPDPPPTTTKSCSLVGPVALVVQALMAVLVIASLLVKRQYEGGPQQGTGVVVPRRKWKVWVFDVSKQLIGQSLIHGSNLLISDQVAHGGGNNPCSLYFLNVLVDTTIGVLVLYLALKGLTKACTFQWGDRGFTSGVYGHPPNIRFWAKQLALYLAALLIMKIFVLVLFAFTLDSVLLPLAGWILNWMRTWSQVVFVMAIFPLFMNVIQFCLIDSLIKGRELGSDDNRDTGYHYTAAPSTVPKDIEEGVTSSTSFEHMEDNAVYHEEEPHGSSSDTSLSPHTDRGTGKTRESSSRASKRFPGGSGRGCKTPQRSRSRTASRELTPPTLSTSLSTTEHTSLKPRSGAMSRTRSSDGYGSTGSTEPSPAFRGLKLVNDDDVDDGGEFQLKEERQKAFQSETDTTAVTRTVIAARESVVPDTTPRPDTGNTFQPPSPTVAPKRIGDDVRIQARRSLSSEGNHITRRSQHRGRRNDHHDTHHTAVIGSDSDEEGGTGNVVMLNDV